MTTVPEILHLTCLGDLQFSEEYKNAVLRFLDNNPSYQVYIWVDGPSIDEVQHGLPQKKVKVRQAKETIPCMYLTTYYQMIRVEAFYAASDFLRLIALYCHGGIYTDLNAIPFAEVPAIEVDEFYGFKLPFRQELKDISYDTCKSKLRSDLKNPFNSRIKEFIKQVFKQDSSITWNQVSCQLKYISTQIKHKYPEFARYLKDFLQEKKPPKSFIKFLVAAPHSRICGFILLHQMKVWNSVGIHYCKEELLVEFNDRHSFLYQMAFYLTGSTYISAIMLLPNYTSMFLSVPNVVKFSNILAQSSHVSTYKAKAVISSLLIGLNSYWDQQRELYTPRNLYLHASVLFLLLLVKNGITTGPKIKEFFQSQQTTFANSAGVNSWSPSALDSAAGSNLGRRS